MKIRLTQSKSGSTGALNLRHELLLHAFHFRGAGSGFVVEPTQVKQTVGNVETQLVLERCAKRARLAPRCFHTDDDFAVLESDHVGGTGFIEKAAMKLSDPTIGHEDHVYSTDIRQRVLSPASKLQTFDDGRFREILQRSDSQRNSALTIQERYRRG
jgi:hypothetical protein